MLNSWLEARKNNGDLILSLKFIVTLCLAFFLISCGSPEQKKIAVSTDLLLSQSLAKQNFIRADEYILKIKLTENSINIINLYKMLNHESVLRLHREFEYLRQFYPQMSEIHKFMFDDMSRWHYLNQIYHQEISPPVRILQRDQLYLAPSEVDFKHCQEEQSDCATDVRHRLTSLMTVLEITKALKKMALKDPCINLSSRLQDEAKANRCLRKSKGDLVIQLLPIPRFNSAQWLQSISP